MPTPSHPTRRQVPWVSLGGDALKALLSAPTVAKTTHFVLQAFPEEPVAQELPTGVAPDRTESVDNLGATPTTVPAPTGLAMVVPKRHAKHAVTRNLVKRQMREAVRCSGGGWAGRQLLIRQRRAFNRERFRSAASDALRDAVRDELNRLFLQLRCP